MQSCHLSEEEKAIEELRISEMQETHKLMRLEFNKCFKHFCRNSSDTDIHLHLLKERLAYGPLLRGFFTRKIAEYLTPSSGLDLFYAQRLPFLVEATMTVLYLQNQQLDGKYGLDISDRARSRSNLQQLGLLFHIQNFIRKEFPDRADTIITHLQKMVEVCNEGQLLENQFGGLKSYKKRNRKLKGYCSGAAAQLIEEEIVEELLGLIFEHLPQKAKNKSQFLRLYLHRVYLANASFYIQVIKMVSDLMQAEQKSAAVESLIRWSTKIAILRQIINDNCDFIPRSRAIGTPTRLPEDAMSDLRNGIISLPLFIYLKSGHKGIVYNVLQANKETKHQLPLKKQEKILQAMIRSGSLETSKKIGRAYADLIQQEVPAKYTLLANMCSTAYGNRFYRALDSKGEITGKTGGLLWHRLKNNSLTNGFFSFLNGN